jgi:hypothetical protein
MLSATSITPEAGLEQVVIRSLCRFVACIERARQRGEGIFRRGVNILPG